MFLRHRHGQPFVLFRWFNAGFEALSHGYARMVRGFIRFRWGLLAGFAVMLFGTYSLWERVPSTFLPVEDQGYFFVVVQGPDGSSLERTDAVAKQVRDLLQAEPGIELLGNTDAEPFKRAWGAALVLIILIGLLSAAARVIARFARVRG